MIEPNFECAMCGRDLLQTSVPFSFVIIDGETKNVCKFCLNKLWPDEIKSVIVTAYKDNKMILIKEYNLGLFLSNNFIEKDIKDYHITNNEKLTRYLRKILDIKDKEIIFEVKLNLIKKRFNKCEICNKILDDGENIYLKTGKNKSYIQVCKKCEKL